VVTALASGVAFTLAAVPAIVVAAWFSPIVPAGGRVFGVLTFAVATLCFASAFGARYAHGEVAGCATPLRIAAGATLATTLVWGYGHAWLIEPSVSRLSVLAPLVGLVRGAGFALALVVSASPLLMPSWWLTHRLLERYGARLRVAAR
jgi:hypothetical protein